jgi:hypothetical protein
MLVTDLQLQDDGIIKVVLHNDTPFYIASYSLSLAFETDDGFAAEVIPMYATTLALYPGQRHTHSKGLSNFGLEVDELNSIRADVVAASIISPSNTEFSIPDC